MKRRGGATSALTVGVTLGLLLGLGIITNVDVTGYRAVAACLIPTALVVLALLLVAASRR